MFMYANSETAVFIKNEVRLLKLFLKVTARKSFVFFSWFTKKIIYFDIVIFQVSGKNYIVKNKNCIVFPES